VKQHVVSEVDQEVLAEPFPWTVAQGVILLLRRVFKGIEMCMGELSMESNGIETVVVRFGVASILATVGKPDRCVDRPKLRSVAGLSVLSENVYEYNIQL
jgi:hypothetical protein